MTDGGAHGLTSRWWPAVLGLVWIAVVARLMLVSWDIALGVTEAHIVAVGGLALVWLVARRTEEPGMLRLVVWGWVLKMVGTLVRYFVLEVVYGGAGDANRYGFVGSVLSHQIRTGNFGRYDPGKQLIGTQFVEIFTGALFAVTGSSVLGGFFAFSAIGFAGLYMIYRAVRIGAPEVDIRRYAILLFFLPSTLFWPSSIGKESLMMVCIGMVFYGAARMFTQRFGGIPIILAGMGASAMIRPHIALMMGAGLLGATTFVRSEGAGQPGHVPLGKLVRLLIFLVAVAVALSAASSFLKVDQLDASSVSGTLQATNARTSQGGSGFGTTSPLLYPVAVVTVLFRPFPIEAGNLQSAIASVESTLLLALFIRRRAAVRQAFGLIRQNGLFAFTLVYAALFCFAYSSFGNFGLLARQRVQLYPLIVLFLCVTPKQPYEGLRSAGEATVERDAGRRMLASRAASRRVA